jgi:cytosine/adenosine deaminase-related metal-dependent hydrolase
MAKEPVGLIIKKGTIVTVDSERRIIKDGAIAVQGNSIKDVGKTDEIARATSRSRI